MSTPVYRIAKWQETFETADSRKHKRLSWVSLPVGFGSNGYQSLVDQFEDEAPAIYGAWCALVNLAAQMNWRGVLCTSRGEPMSISRIARLTYMPTDVFEKLFDWASSESVGWIEVVERPLANQSTTSQQLANDWTTLQDTTLPNPTGRTEPDGTAPTDRPTDRPEDSKKKLAAAELANQVLETVGDGRAPKAKDRELAFKAAAFELEPELVGYLPTLLELIRDRKRGSSKLENPWAYLKSGMIRACKESELNFDELWSSIAVPSKPEPAGASP